MQKKTINQCWITIIVVGDLPCLYQYHAFINTAFILMYLPTHPHSCSTNSKTQLKALF